ncbi:MAG: MgtC/SapB family protein [Caldilineaceae bacterium]|nr:MgtC/SapB family protein [Caldilineaceae bacterium]MBP8110466.1 MgtC/SapB family protein [Caldilineaceae bacterium]MBP8125498.1 MgtC/SapB family protein [Caldilineaceae bacterium]MBP9075161.1 MgtC/SapB family protein [Caldilineaceae bacterium]
MEQLPHWVMALRGMQWEMAGQLTLAALLGGMVGLERVGHGPAGLRTNIIIAVSSCLFTLLSIYGFPTLTVDGPRDSARIAAQIVSGVGFLGAGTVLHSKSRVRGLTSAATIWLVAAIGMAAGAGAYFLAIFTAVLATFVLVALRPVSEKLSRQRLQRVKQRRAARKMGIATKSGHRPGLHPQLDSNPGNEFNDEDDADDD